MSYRTLGRDKWSRGIQTSRAVRRQRPSLSWRRTTFPGRKDIPRSGKSTGHGTERSKDGYIWKTVSRVHSLEYRIGGSRWEERKQRTTPLPAAWRIRAVSELDSSFIFLLEENIYL